MNEKFDENNFNEQVITDVETAKLALRWALDKVRATQEESLRSRQAMQEKSGQVKFLESQLASKNDEISRILRAHEEEIKAKQDSVEYQFRSRLERITEREKELEDKSARADELLRQREGKLAEEYSRKSEELRGRWSQIEAELWQLRQEQVLKQQEFEKLYASRIEAERKKIMAEAAELRDSADRTSAMRAEELSRREQAMNEELRKQEAVLKWAKDSWQKEVEDRERKFKERELELDKKLLDKNQEAEELRVKIGLLEKQLSDLPESVRKRDQEIDRYKSALESLEGVIRTLEGEKRALQKDSEQKLIRLSESLDAEKARYREMEAEIPKRLKIAIEHERNRFGERLSEIESNYSQDLRKKQEEIDYLERNLKTFEETIKTLQTERESAAQKAEQLQAQHSVKLEEFAFREKQLQSEFDVRMRVELEKHTRHLKSELDSAARIYEDSLRMKVEEIAHLRKELEAYSSEGIALRGQLAEARRAVDAEKERTERELEAQKARLKEEFAGKLAAELDAARRESAAELERKAREAALAAEALKAALADREAELERVRAVAGKVEEEKKIAALQERERASEELRLAQGNFAERARLYEEKVAGLQRALEASRIEREELLLAERERLERLYSEKERGFDSELALRDAELSRIKEDLIKAENARDAAQAELAREREAIEKRAQELSDRSGRHEADFSLRLEEALARESSRFNEVIERKSRELEAAKALRESQEEGYRRTLEELRGKVGEAVSRMEALRAAAEERQAQVNALQADLAEARKLKETEAAHLTTKLAERERQLRDIKSEYEAAKSAAESQALDLNRRASDLLLKLRASEENRAGVEHTIEDLRREIELWKAEGARKDAAVREAMTEVQAARAAAARTVEEVKAKLSAELSGRASECAAQLDAERREFRAANEKLSREFADREKSLIGEIAAVRDRLNAREVEFERLRGDCEELRRAGERLREAMEAEKRRREETEISAESARAAARDRDAELQAQRRAGEDRARELDSLRERLRERETELARLGDEVAGLRVVQNDYEKSKKLLEQLKARLKSWKNQ